MRSSVFAWAFLLTWLGIVGSLTGCLSRPIDSRLGEEQAGRRDWQRRHAHLLRHAEFSQAALLAGLHDLGRLDSAHPVANMSLMPSAHDESVQTPSESFAFRTEPSMLDEHASERGAAETSLDGISHVRMGWTFLIHGNYAGAVAAYREALRQNDRLPQAFLGLAVALRFEGKMNEAKSAIQRALALAPGYAAALVHLGYWYADNPSGRGDYATARQLFRRASQLGDPFAAIALRDLDARERT
ncbi:MAG: hypothetical protein D6690_11695 [Nitrospirae bacterium]|nr:MAG: hypothetical protein D6690_11695 [Nitrospirota bacterium]